MRPRYYKKPNPKKVKEWIANNKKLYSNEIKELDRILEHQTQTLLYIAGKRKDIPTTNQVTGIKSAKRRSMHSSPLPIRKVIAVPTDRVDEKGDPEYIESEEIVHQGMRTDPGVIEENLKNVYIGMAQSMVKLELLKAIAGGVKPNMRKYLVDHVKSALGRDDINAGFLSLNYSNLSLNYHILISNY